MFGLNVKSRFLVKGSGQNIGLICKDKILSQDVRSGCQVRLSCQDFSLRCAVKVSDPNVKSKHLLKKSCQEVCSLSRGIVKMSSQGVQSRYQVRLQEETSGYVDTSG